MQTQFYLDLAKQFTQDSDNVTKLALTFQYRDMEKEKFAQIEKEKQQIEMQHQMKLRESSFKKSLSFLSQRYVLESFFNEVVTCIRSSPQLRDHISTTQFPKNKQNDLATSMYPKMSYVNELLLIAEARKVVWENMGIDQAVNVPKFPSDLIYGLISLGIHSPVVFAVYVSDKMDQKLTDFFKFVSARSQLVIDLYNEEAASAGEDLVASEAELMEAGSSFKVTDSASIASDTSHVPVSA